MEIDLKPYEIHFRDSPKSSPCWTRKCRRLTGSSWWAEALGWHWNCSSGGYGADSSLAGSGELPAPGASGKKLRKNLMTATEHVSGMSLLLHKWKWALLKIDGTLRYHCNVVFMHTYSGHLSLKPSAGVCWSHLLSLGAIWRWVKLQWDRSSCVAMPAQSHWQRQWAKWCANVQQCGSTEVSDSMYLLQRAFLFGFWGFCSYTHMQV